MFITNTIKIVGCVADAVGRRIRCSPMPSSASAPPRIRPRNTASSPSSCRTASSWSPTAGSRASPSASIILGTVLGGVLIQRQGVRACCCTSTSRASTRAIDTPAEAAIAVIVVFYVIAALFNLYMPRHRRRPQAAARAIRSYLIRDFARCVALPVARQAGADLARDHDAVLGRRRDAAVHRASNGRAARSASTCRKAAILQGVAAVGIALGAVLAALSCRCDSSVQRACRSASRWASS